MSRSRERVCGEHKTAIRRAQISNGEICWICELEKQSPPPPADERVVELEQEIEDGWDTLINDYNTDNKCELIDEETTVEQVKIRDGIQQLGEVAYQWRQQRDDLRELVTKFKAALAGKGGAT